MPTTYHQPAEESDYCTVLENAIAKHHPLLKKHGVTVDLLEARPEYDDNGQPKAAALKLGGYPCTAVVRIVNQADRAKGLADAEIKIDGHWWDSADYEEKMALLDHELTHLQLVMDGDHVKRDGSERPKLKTRKHDRQMGWFDEVAERHGKASQEHQQARELLTKKFAKAYQLDLNLQTA